MSRPPPRWPWSPTNGPPSWTGASASSWPRPVPRRRSSWSTPRPAATPSASSGSEFPAVTYAVCPAGRGATGTARNISYRMASGDVLAFIDDDAFAEPDWLERLLPLFDDPSVGAVGRSADPPAARRADRGASTPSGGSSTDGTLTGHFAADPGRVGRGGPPARGQHVLPPLGARPGWVGSATATPGPASVRRPTCAFGCSGPATGSSTRPTRWWSTWPAPYAKGQRFDLRYAYWAQKNHLILLIRNFGIADPRVRRFVAASWRATLADSAVRLERARSRATRHEIDGASKAAAAAFLRASLAGVASVAGVAGGLRLTRCRPEGSAGVAAPQGGMGRRARPPR